MLAQFNRRLNRLSRSKFVRDTLTLQAGKLGTTALSVIALAVTIRLMGLENYGVWKLTLALFAIWQAVEMTGVGMSTATRLSLAIGRHQIEDATQNILDLMAFYVKITMAWALMSVLVAVIFGPPLARQLYGGDARIGQLAAWFSITVAADVLYTLVVVTIQSRRLMREFALLQNANQVMLFSCILVAMLVRPTPESMVIARLVYSYSTLIMALVVYHRLRAAGPVEFPPFNAVFRRAVRVPVGPYWRSGVAMALDKNISNLYMQVPVTLVGVFHGEAAAGYLGTALDIVNRSSLLTGPIMDNMQAVVPQAVGRGDFIGLRRNFGRVLAGLGALGVAFYTILALAAPLVVPLVFGPEAAPAVPAVMILALMGAMTAVGGIFGPLYRAFEIMRAALWIKIAAAVIMVPVGLWLVATFGAAGGAWMVNGLYALSIGLTAAVTLWALRARAETPVQSP